MQKKILVNVFSAIFASVFVSCNENPTTTDTTVDSSGRHLDSGYVSYNDSAGSARKSSDTVGKQFEALLTFFGML